jgi:NAD(P)-dependent dehydrogenase (short-subunit alcohol dehydrogenase family)
LIDEIKKKHTLVVGGTRGIGQALARILAEKGHKVSVIGRRLPPAVVDQNRSNVRYWLLDLADRETLLKGLREIIREFGKLANIVFFQRYRGKEDNWLGEIETSLTATRMIIENVIDDFEESGGSIVIVSSINSHFISKDLSVGYHVAKAALNQMARYYAVVLGPRGIRINSVSPGTVLKEENRDFYFTNQRLLNFYKRIAPRRRMGTAEEVADIIAFLLSSKAALITGQDIVADCGVSLQWQESLSSYEE